MRSMSEQKAGRGFSWGWAIAIVLAVLIAWASGVLISWWWRGGADLAVQGQFGDSFAPVTALFSAVALIAAFASFYSQRQELESQRKSAEEQSRVLAQAVEHLARQAEASGALLEQQNEANDIASKQASAQRRANHLAHLATTLEAERQIQRIDDVAIASLAEGVITSLHDIPDDLRNRPIAIWHDIVKNYAGSRDPWRDTIVDGELQRLMYRRHRIKKLIDLADLSEF